MELPFVMVVASKLKTPSPTLVWLVAYSTSEGQKSFGDRKNGGIWTYYLCKNIRESKKIGEVLSQTFSDVVKMRKQFQEPMTVCTDDTRNIVLKQGNYHMHNYNVYWIHYTMCTKYLICSKLDRYMYIIIIFFFFKLNPPLLHCQR